MKPPRKLSDSEVQFLAHQTLKDEGLLLPQTDDEIAQLEDTLSGYSAVEMRADDALNIARQQAAPQPTAPAFPVAPVDDASRAIAEDLALAARHGTNIPPAVWEKMKSDRVKAAHERTERRKH